MAQGQQVPPGHRQDKDGLRHTLCGRPIQLYTLIALRGVRTSCIVCLKAEKARGLDPLGGGTV